MAIYKEDFVDVELTKGVIFRSFIQRTIGEDDDNGDRFGFRCFRNGEPVSLNGTTVIGHFIRADGVTIEIDGGAVTGDSAYIVLPASCYAVEGSFTLAIKLSGGGVSGTIRMVDGTVVRTTNGAIIDPGTVIPDLSDYLEAVNDVTEAAEIINAISITAELIDGEDYDIVITTAEGDE